MKALKSRRVELWLGGDRHAGTLGEFMEDNCDAEIDWGAAILEMLVHGTTTFGGGAVPHARLRWAQ